MAPTTPRLVACLLSAACTALTAAGSVPAHERALPNAASGGYAPAVVDCPPSRPTIRSAATLSREETDWLARRRPATVQPMADLVSRAGIAGFDGAAYINSYRDNASALPNIGIAVSGGGYRALMNGAGFMAAADARTPGTLDAGGIGGLLQATTYVAGLSGGGWLVGSLYSNNFSTVVDLMDGSPGSSVWAFENNIFEGPKEGIAVISTVSYWDEVSSAVSSKADAGFQTSVTDYWGRALSYQLINASSGGLAYTWSSFALDPQLSSGAIPMPVIVTDGRDPGVTIVSLNATNYEINPWEMGSFDPTVYGFAPTQYLASNFSGGVVPSGGSCVLGFDNAGYMMGTSSSLFNTFLTTNISQYANVPAFVGEALTKILAPLGDDNNDIAQWVPNPFLGWRNATNPTADQAELGLVDGGEDLQNIPLSPLLQPLRAVDVIFAVDSSADTPFNWPNGTALRATYDRSLSPMANGTLFPPVPDANTFINLGLNRRPAFFGCDPSNFTLAPGQSAPPLVVYVPNAPYTASSNVSTFDPSYTRQQKLDFVRNGLNAASQANGTVDPSWPACVACAVLSRSLARTRTRAPDACRACFSRYCWNGTLATAQPAPYEPRLNATAHEGAAAPSLPAPALAACLAAAAAASLLLV